MKTLSRTALAACLSVLAFQSLADNDKHKGGLWVAAFLCGSNPVSDNRVVRAQYATTVTLTSIARRTIYPRLELSFIFPPVPFTPPLSAFGVPGASSDPVVVSLGRGESISIDCEEFHTGDAFSTGPVLFPSGNVALYVQGSLLVSNVRHRELDVQVAYTARTLAGDGVSISHVPIPAVGRR